MLGWELPPYNSGGLGTACYQLSKELSNSGIDIDFVLPYEADHAIDFMNVISTSNSSSEFVNSTQAAYSSDSFHGRTYGLNSVIHDAYANVVTELAESGDFDVIHAHDWLTFRAGIKAKQISGKPLIAHVHATEYDRAGANPGNPFVEEIEYSALTIADKIVAVSEYTKQVIVTRYKIPAEKIEVVHNSIDIDSYPTSSHTNVFRYLALMKQEGWKVIGSIGRLTIQKGLTNLIKAMQLVVQKAPKTIFLVVGNGDQRDELIMLSAELGLAKNVLFVDFQRGQEQRDAFEILDIFAMPSVSEPFGITPLEAIGFGVPTLISKQSGVSEVISNALKVDYWDINKLADQLISAVTNQSLLDTLAKESGAEFKTFNWKKSAEKIKSIYHMQQLRVSA